ncbi:MAG: hypothetical protein V4496_07845 [Pseudomonadota bacterium]
MSKCCAIAFHQTGIVLSGMGRSKVLQLCATTSELEQCVSQQGLRSKAVVGVLGPSDYQLLRIKRPTVQANEMMSAILWQEQARFSLSVDQLAIDYVECPSITNAEKRLYVVAVAKRTLRDRYQALLGAHVQPMKITLPEFMYAHYSAKKYASESVVIWVNYFQDAPQVFAFYQQELIATLKLPKIDSAVMSEACLTALNLFYLAEVKAFSAAPLWVMNGLFTIEAAMLTQLNGRVAWTISEAESDSFYSQALKRYNHSTISHAYYGMMANE